VRRHARRMSASNARLLLAAAALLAGGSCARKGADAPPVRENPRYVSWATLETDKLATVWLLQRVVAPHAEFVFVPKHTLVTNGIAFDTPDAELRRSHSLSCFQSVLRKHAIRDPVLQYIGRLTHDIEVNHWAQKRYPESAGLEARIRELIATYGADPQVCVAHALPVFDALRARLRDKK